MARQKDSIRSRRIRIEGLLKPGVDPEIDKLLTWLDGLPKRKRFPMVIQRLMMGGVLETVVENGDMEAARAQAEKIASAFVVDDDE